MDMMLPVMSGLAATEYIMAHCPTPILIVSASINRGELFKIYEALAAGAVDVLEKPTGDEPDGVWERRFLATVKLVSRIRVITHPRARLAALATRRRHSRHHRAVEPELRPAIRARRDRRLDRRTRRNRRGPARPAHSVPAADPARPAHRTSRSASAFADWLDGQTDRRVAHPEDGASVASAVGRA